MFSDFFFYNYGRQIGPEKDPINNLTHTKGLLRIIHNLLTVKYMSKNCKTTGVI